MNVTIWAVIGAFAPTRWDKSVVQKGWEGGIGYQSTRAVPPPVPVPVTTGAGVSGSSTSGENGANGIANSITNSSTMPLRFALSPELEAAWIARAQSFAGHVPSELLANCGNSGNSGNSGNNTSNTFTTTSTERGDRERYNSGHNLSTLLSADQTYGCSGCWGVEEFAVKSYQQSQYAGTYV